MCVLFCLGLVWFCLVWFGFACLLVVGAKKTECETEDVRL